MPNAQDPQIHSLFGDISPTQSLRHEEVINIPPQDSLAQILADVQADPNCGACKGGLPLVFGIGPERAELMLIGEGPGIDDVQSEAPFQGQAGVLLTRMLAAINVSRA